MDAPQNKAASMDGKMPLTVGKKKMASAAYLDVVQLVSGWALSTGCLIIVVVAVAYTLDHYNVPVPCSPSYSSFVLRCVELTEARAAEVAATESVTTGMLWFAAVALAPLLPCRYRRVRRALAYLALALAVVGHIMYARASLHLYAADPGYLFDRRHDVHGGHGHLLGGGPPLLPGPPPGT